MALITLKTTLKEQILGQIDWSIENFSFFSRSGTFVKSKSFLLDGFTDCKWYAGIKLVESGSFQYLALFIQNDSYEFAQERNIRVKCVQRAENEFGYASEFTVQRLNVCPETEKCYLAISIGSINNKLINDTLHLKITLSKIFDHTIVKHEIRTEVLTNN